MSCGQTECRVEQVPEGRRGERERKRERERERESWGRREGGETGAKCP